MTRIAFALFIAFSLFVTGCGSGDSTPPPDETPAPQLPSISYNIDTAFPHDTSFFTEGLEVYNNTLIESTGNYGSSRLVQYEIGTGKLLKSIALDKRYFGEGITILHDTLYQLTYKEGVAFLYDAKTFRKLGERPFNGEGWGLTNNGKELIASNGSGNLYFYEPGTMRLLRVQGVSEAGTPPVNINELEYINGYIYSNQWQYNTILKIDPSSGQVVGVMDLTDLAKRTPVTPYDYLNGIAYNPATKKVYVTGKNWPTMYNINFSF